MTSKIIIGVLGKAGSGKDEFCKAVIKAFSSEYSIERIALADALKAEVDELGPFGLCIKHGVPYDNDPPLNDPMCKTGHGKQRHLLQYWGQLKRQDDPFYWVKKLEHRINQSPATIILVPDVRYYNEALFIKSTYGFTVRMTRNGHIGLTGDAAQHVSETELDGYKTDFSISVGANDLTALHEQSKDVFEQIAATFTLEEFDQEELFI